MIALGIDPSATATGLTVLASVSKGHPKLLHEEIVTPKKLIGMPRVSFILGRIIWAIETFKPDMIAIENYGLNFRRKTSIIPLITLGAIIRYYFQQEGIAYLDPTPGEHKKFITGSGNTPKDDIASWITHNWGHVALDDNTADSYGLACMALAHRNQLTNQNLTMREVAASVKVIFGLCT